MKIVKPCLGISAVKMADEGLFGLPEFIGLL